LFEEENMAFCRITACLTVEEKNALEVTEALHALIDSFIVKHLPVFDSEVCSKPAGEVNNAEEVRIEIQSDTL
jgi:hypothetical protein